MLSDDPSAERRRPPTVAPSPTGAGDERVRVLRPIMNLAQCEQVVRQMGEQIRLGVDLGSRRGHIAELHASLLTCYADAEASLAAARVLVAGDTPERCQMQQLCDRLHEELAASRAGLEAALSGLDAAGAGPQASDL
ncbi:hypothetical protein [Methylobacterium oryzihabitans]|uniref:Uncharacterized protein n=1 Tax=Methylobacterium oryzihabitans TaxID=2499852 RepID=A0A3S2YP86_9HYPH|nr:hypothetical protein [Methylobacterium oryzihabitans]RVU16165.1 hypothetical protein EOE48_17575 [Methylobacterium oryzihabitans]